MTMMSTFDHSDPLRFTSMSTAPLGAVMLAVAALWISATPQQLRALGLDIDMYCALRLPGPEPIVHIIAVDRSGALTWDDEALADRAALDARLRTVAALEGEPRHEVLVDPRAGSEYGTVLSVFAAIQRSGLKRMDIVVENHAGKLELMSASTPLPAVPSE